MNQTIVDDWGSPVRIVGKDKYAEWVVVEFPEDDDTPFAGHRRAISRFSLRAHAGVLDAALEKVPIIKLT